MEQAFILYGPINLAEILMRKKILNPFHYYIIRSLKESSISYLASVLYGMLAIELEIPAIYHDFIDFVKTESTLKFISSVLKDVGKCIGIATMLSVIPSSCFNKHNNNVQKMYK